jgi:hypothetical protein
MEVMTNWTPKPFQNTIEISATRFSILNVLKFTSYDVWIGKICN